MVLPSDPGLQQSMRAAALAGCWKLAPRRALSLRPRAAGLLLIAQGQAWATLGVRPQGHGNESGDHCLQAGQQLLVRAGQHLVLESFDDAPVCFDWTPLPSSSRGQRLGRDGAVAQPLRDLRQALGLAGGALVRLLLGLAGCGVRSVRH